MFFMDTTNTAYHIVRTDKAGVFFGKIKERNGSEIQLTYARRIWYWSGASSLSELALRGTSNPKECKFPCSVPEITLLGVIEIIPCSEDAVKSIQGVREWTQH